MDTLSKYRWYTRWRIRKRGVLILCICFVSAADDTFCMAVCFVQQFCSKCRFTSTARFVLFVHIVDWLGRCLWEYPEVKSLYLVMIIFRFFNPLTPNDHYSGLTAALASKRYILYIYSTNIGIAYFKPGIYCPFFFFLFKMQFVS